MSTFVPSHPSMINPTLKPVSSVKKPKKKTGRGEHSIMKLLRVPSSAVAVTSTVSAAAPTTPATVETEETTETETEAGGSYLPVLALGGVVVAGVAAYWVFFRG